MISEMLSNKLIIYTLVISLLMILLTLIICLILRRKPYLVTYIKNKKKVIHNKKLKVDIGNAQIIGTREKQDDSFATERMNYGLLAVVADGIGGYINGNLASSIAVETYLDEFQKYDVTGNISYFFNTSAVLSNERIRDEFGEAKGGTTLVAVIITNNRMHWSSIGDSNIAVFRDGRLIMINRKENYKNWLEDQYYAGAISRESALADSYGKRLVNYIGYDGFKMADSQEQPIYLRKRDKVLLYSDGVELLPQIEMERILSKRWSAQKMADAIITKIERMNVKNKDNATLIILSMK